MNSNDIRNEKMLRIIMFISLILFIATFITYVILSITGISKNLNEFTSFPWYTSIVVNTTIFIIPLLLEGLFIIYLYKKRKNIRRKCEEKY